jgi:hypothetical protein
MPLERIRPFVRDFLDYCKTHPELEFLVTPVGCGLAGYKPHQIAGLFSGQYIPANVVIPESFEKYLT